MKLPKYIVPISAVGTGVGLIVLFKEKIGGTRYAGNERIAGRTVIVTGASSGIGKETAKDLANRGGRIIMACRDMDKCERVRTDIIKETFNTNVHCRKLDLASLKSIRAFAEEINTNEKRLDVLINNAGIMRDSRSVTEDGFELHLGVNYLGQFLLTNLLVDKLTASAPSRVLNLTTIGYDSAKIRFSDLNSERNFNSEFAYKQSKLAIVMFTWELAKRLQNRGVTVNAVSPGLVQTNLRNQLSMNQSWISGIILKPFWILAFKTPIQGAQTSVYCAVEPTISSNTGASYADCAEVPLAEIATNEENSKRLWLISEKWTQLT